MKKIIALLLACMMLIACTACAAKTEPAAPAEDAASTCKGFFCRLENELYSTAEFVAVVHESFGSCKKARGMCIMPAGMGNTIYLGRPGLAA